MKVYIDDSVCTGCGICCDNCPEVFEMGDTTAFVKVPEVPLASEECAEQTAGDCPVEAIKVEK